jgi:photosystem II stability/assembly factor-like uncharacterized protein
MIDTVSPCFSGNSRFRTVSVFVAIITRFSLITIISSCSKEKIELTFTRLSSGITNDLNHVFFINDSIGYVCGGDRYFKGDLLKTTDGGYTWHDQSTGEMTKALYRLDFISEDTGFSCGYDGKIFKTTDGGANWHFFQTDYYRPLRSIYMLDGQRGFACGGDGYKSGYLLRSTDGGDDWLADTSLEEYRDLVFFDESNGVVCGYGLIMYTTDGGQTWTYTNAKQDFFVAMDFVNEATGYAIGYTGSIWKTTDGGRSWERLRNANVIFKPQWYLNCIAFINESVGYVAGEGGCFLKTSDGGQSWRPIENAPEVDWKGISLVSDGGFICGTGGEIYRFLD